MFASSSFKRTVTRPCSRVGSRSKPLDEVHRLVRRPTCRDSVARMVHLTEQSVAEMAPNDKALVDGRGLIKKGALKKLAKNDDGTLVFGLCQGSGKLPYEVSMDLATGGDRPTLRCTCPSRLIPCKHQLGLMLAFVAGGDKFPVAAPPAALVEKRQKLVERNEKKAAAPAEAAAPKKVDKAAQEKKTREQSDGLDTLETF